MSYKPEIVGIIGAGRFGTTLATLVANNCEVLLFTRHQKTAAEINAGVAKFGYQLPKNVTATTSAEEICKRSKVIIPVLPSSAFRDVMQIFAPHLFPYHVVIHATKGFDIRDVDFAGFNPKVSRKNIRTMSSVVTDETQVVRVGCISGPNLSAEIRRGLPSATVLASEFDEVITLGHQILGDTGFRIYGSHDLLGTEVAGALKNMIAIGTGMIAGLELGKNIEALFITRGLREMMVIGRALGANVNTFFGTAGLGDLIATATSKDSRNYAFGLQMASGKSLEEINRDYHELTEGVRTIKLMHHFASRSKLEVPIVEMLYAVIYQGLPLHLAVEYLLEYPYAIDVDYL